VHDTMVEILLVEDNPNDVALTLRAFKKYNIGNRIHVVHDGAEALEFVFGTGAYAERSFELTPRVILLDLKLPKVDGLEVLKQVKADPNLRTVPIVVLTSSREEHDLLRSYDLGTNAYVVKPLDFRQFMEALRELGLFWAVLNEPPPESADERQ
jgi:two-component system, response regulator